MARYTQDEWARAHPNLKPVGDELKGPCPACGGDDRFRVHADGRFFCRKCCPDGGDTAAFRRILDAAGLNGTTRRREWTYRTVAGETVRAVRIDGPTGKRVLREPKGVEGPYLPLMMPVDGGGPVVLVEGETCAEAVHAAGFTAVCWLGGTGTLDQTAWREFVFGGEDRVEIVLWPDHDKPGRQAMGKLAAILRDHPEVDHFSLKAVRVPPDKPEKWDAADAGADEIRQLVGEADESAFADLLGAVDAAEADDEATPANPKKKLTELAAAKILLDSMAGRWCFDSRKKVWRRLRDGRLWTEDDEGALREAGETIGAYKGARGMHRKHSLANALALTAVQIGMYERRWDTGGDLCCPGGIIRCADGTWHPGAEDPAARHTRLTAVDPDMEGEAPEWERFLRVTTGGDADLIRDVWCFVGYTLTTDTREEMFYVPFGPPGTGKTTFIRTVEYLMGDYARVVSIDRLIGKHPSHRQWMAGLDGARLVISSEPPPTSASWRSGEMSSLVSGETQEANFMRGNSFNFPPVAKIWITANEIPRASGPNSGILRRIVPLPFTRPVPDDKKDRGLYEKLKAEAPAILGWAVRGLAEYRQHGMGTLSQSVLDRRREYAAEQDDVGRWIATSGDVALDIQGAVPKGQAHDLYAAWCNEEGIRALGKRQFFARMLTRHGIGEGKTSGGVRIWTGLMAVAPDDMPDARKTLR